MEKQNQPGQPEIKMPMDKWVEQIAVAAGTAAAERVLGRHQAECQIRALAAEVWGNGKPGLKEEHLTQKLRLDNLEKQTAGPRNYLRELSKPVLAALLVAVLFYFLNEYKTTASAAAGPVAPPPTVRRP